MPTRNTLPVRDCMLGMELTIHFNSGLQAGAFYKIVFVFCIFCLKKKISILLDGAK